MILFYYYLIIFSLIGYGTILCNFLVIKKNNLGIIGLAGIFFLTFLSLMSSIITHHGYLFNISVLVLGIIFFLKNYLNNQYKNNDLLIVILIFTVLVLFILVGKNHDDFPYYHFPYTYMLTQDSHAIGIGQLNNGFRNPSSLFFFNSLFFFPLTEIYLLNIGSVFFLGFANFFFLKNIFDKKFFINYRFFNFINLIFFIYFNTTFARLSEYGTDRGGQILIVVVFILLLLMLNMKTISLRQNSYYLKVIFIISALIISLKPFYLIYAPLMLVILYYKNLRLILLQTINLKILLFITFFCFFSFFYTFINSGCIIFPASFTCFENLEWSIPKKEVDEVKIWYELWSKAGASPNYIVEDRIFYIKNLNWINNWMKNYFFNKVSDYFIVLLLISLINLFIFKSKKYHKVNDRIYYLPYFFILICLFEWFFNHPTLRYGGYHLFALLIFLPLSFKLEKFSISWKKYLRKCMILIFITSSIFVYKNFLRLYQENNKYDYNVFKNPNYKFIGGDKNFYYRYQKKLNDKNFNYEYKNIFFKKILIIKNSK
jgi:hypothetical protein